MGDFQASVVLPRSRVETFDYLRQPKNFLKLFPDSATKHLGIRLPDVLNTGERLEFNFTAFGTRMQIVQEITDLRHPEHIIARQLKGPFRLWVHEQRYADAPDGSTLLTNLIRFEPPGGLLGFIATRKMIMAHLDEWLTEGHERLRQTMESELNQTAQK